LQAVFAFIADEQKHVSLNVSPSPPTCVFGKRHSVDSINQAFA